jgi:hypothetical protein
MEWLLLLIVSLTAALYIGWPHVDLDEPECDELVTLRDRRTVLLAELRDFDRDLANGRISEDDRRAGRRTVAPELRDVTERLRSLGESTDSAPPASPEPSN